MLPIVFSASIVLQGSVAPVDGGVFANDSKITVCPLFPFWIKDFFVITVLFHPCGEK